MQTKRRREFAAVLCAIGASFLSVATADEIKLRDRAAFASLLGAISVGQSAKDVEARLGPPDLRVQRDTDTSITYEGVKEVWYYGVDKATSFPTLGRVYFGTTDAASTGVVRVYGRKPCDLRLKEFKEENIRTVLGIISRCPVCNTSDYDPSSIIICVNSLRPLGPEVGFTLLEEFLRVSPAEHGETSEKLGLLMRVLLDPMRSTPKGFLPLVLGRYSPESINSIKGGRFPILIEDDIPFLQPSAYSLAGQPYDIMSEWAFFRDKCDWSRKTLSPSRPVYDVYQDLLKGEKWRPLPRQVEDKRDLLVQVLRLCTGGDEIARRIGRSPQRSSHELAAEAVIKSSTDTWTIQWKFEDGRWRNIKNKEPFKSP